MVASLRKSRGRPANPDVRQQRQAEILDAAARTFAKNGYAQTDVQVVADAVNVGKGTIYRHFPSKERLFLAAVDRGMLLLREHVDRARATTEDPLEQVARAIEAYLAFFDEHAEYVELIVQERAVFKDRKKPTYFEHRDKNIGRWIDLFQGLIAAGRVRPMPEEHITNVLSNAVYGRMFTNYFTGRSQPLAAQAHEILDVVFLGILTDAERAKRDGMRHKSDRQEFRKVR